MFEEYKNMETSTGPEEKKSSNESSEIFITRNKESLPLQKKYSLSQQTSRGLGAKYGKIFIPTDRSARTKKKKPEKDKDICPLTIQPVKIIPDSPYISPKEVKIAKELMFMNVRNSIRSTSYSKRGKKLISKPEVSESNTKDDSNYFIEKVDPFTYNIKIGTNDITNTNEETAETSSRVNLLSETEIQVVETEGQAEIEREAQIERQTEIERQAEIELAEQIIINSMKKSENKIKTKRSYRKLSQKIKMKKSSEQDICTDMPTSDINYSSEAYANRINYWKRFPQEREAALHRAHNYSHHNSYDRYNYLNPHLYRNHNGNSIPCCWNTTNSGNNLNWYRNELPYPIEPRKLWTDIDYIPHPYFRGNIDMSRFPSWPPTQGFHPTFSNPPPPYPMQGIRYPPPPPPPWVNQHSIPFTRNDIFYPQFQNYGYFQS